jgi:hypothetical protein
VRHRSPRTEAAYVEWIRRFVLFHGKRHPSELGPEAVSAFLNHLAVEGKVAASTQNQALNALVFLYRHVLGRELEQLGGLVRAHGTRRLPVVLTQTEVRSLLAELHGVEWLVASLLYGAARATRIGSRPCLRPPSVRCSGICKRCALCTGAISPRASARWRCLTP